MPEATAADEILRPDLLERLDQLRLIDDDFFSEVLDGETDAVGFIVNTILERDDIEIIHAKSQVEYRSANHRSIVLDIQAKDAEGRMLDIEIQRSDGGNNVKRARFHSSMLDRDMLDKGQDFDDLAESYVIFITEHDKYGVGLPVYHINRTVQEMNHTLFGDGSHILYVNGEYQNPDHPIGQLMLDFHQTKAEKIASSVLAEKVRNLKELEGGQREMCEILDEMCKEYEEKGQKKGQKKGMVKGMAKGMKEGMAQGMAQGMERGIAQGMEKGRIETCLESARKMLQYGKLTYEEIAEYASLPLTKVKELAGAMAL